MASLTVHVLGISGAHRRGRNTSFLVQEALRSAEKVKGVQTKFIELSDYKIEYCTHCNRCAFDPHDLGRSKGGSCVIQDGMQDIYPILEEADGIIFGSPVYISNMSARMKTFLDRLRPLAFRGTFGYKVGGAASVAILSAGGQEITNTSILNAFHVLEGIAVSGMGTGASGASGPPFGPRGHEDDGKNIAVKNQNYALTSAIMLGRKVAEIAKLIKYGKNALGAEFDEFCSVYHFPLKSKEWEGWDIRLL